MSHWPASVPGGCGVVIAAAAVVCGPAVTGYGCVKVGGGFYGWCYGYSNETSAQQRKNILFHTDIFDPLGLGGHP